MSDVYIKEPSTRGKVILQTTHGDLEIELWSTETPKACRNFCQLVVEGFYNGSMFTRIIKDFCIQGGDPTGSGDSCESIYGVPYADEIHPRLKFRYRGMMGIASAGKKTKTNGNQFFIILNRAPSLDGKHTLFGKIVGQTVYNLVRISECEVDKNDRPRDPPRIVRAELVWNPFEDLEPRVRAPPPISLQLKPASEEKRLLIKNKNILSFGDGESGSDSDARISPVKKGPKSAHDLLNDPKLLKAPAASVAAAASSGGGDDNRLKKAATEAMVKGAPSAGGRPKVPAHLVGSKDEDSGEEDDGDSDSDEMDDVAVEKSMRRQEEILQLKRSIVNLDSKAPEEARTSKKIKVGLEEMRAGYTTRTKAKAQGKEGRRRANDDVLAALRSFQERLRGVVQETQDGAYDDAKKDSEATKSMMDNEYEKEKSHSKTKTDTNQNPERGQVEREEGTFAAIWKEGDDESDANWLVGGGLKFHTSGDKAFKMAAMKANDSLEIFDPLAAKGNAEILAEARIKRSEQLRPHTRKPPPQDKKAKW